MVLFELSLEPSVVPLVLPHVRNRLRQDLYTVSSDIRCCWLTLIGFVKLGKRSLSEARARVCTGVLVVGGLHHRLLAD